MEISAPPRIHARDEIPVEDEEPERSACLRISPSGFQIRHPPPPDLLSSRITPDSKLFHTIHMGAAVVDLVSWRLIITGLVEHEITLSFADLINLEPTTITSFHECYGSPIAPPTKPLWRIGNVHWTGVPLSHLLSLGRPHPSAKFVWSSGLDYGSFGGVKGIPKYQKDLPMSKAMSSEVVLAYEMNGEPLSKERGGPVRLVVPGWFGTNSTKWLCRLEVREQRARSHFTTTWYNEVDPTKGDGSLRPIWDVEVNSMIVRPTPSEIIEGNAVEVVGWAWGCEEVVRVEVSVDGGISWEEAAVEKRKEFSWQRFKAELCLSPAEYKVIARARAKDGTQQPLSGRRNHVHGVEFTARER